MIKKENVVLWGVSDTKTILEAKKFIENYKKNVEIILIVKKSRANEFSGQFKKIIKAHADIHPSDFGLLIRAFFLNTRLHVVPCGSDYNLYYAVIPILNLVSFFQKRALIGLLKDGCFTRIPIEAQLVRSKLKYVALFLAISLIVSKQLFGFACFLIFILALAKLLDSLFGLLLKHFRRADYLMFYMFKREEMPYTSFGWMHPYNESYFNKLIYSKEGLAAKFYDINEDYFPVYNPSSDLRRLVDHFNFVNTHSINLNEHSKPIYVLGGSVAQGLINDPNSYHQVLEKLLDASQSIKVIPWAIGGYHSTQSRVLVDYSLTDRPMSALVSLDFYNDVLYTILGVPPGDTQRSQRKYLAKYNTVYKILNAFFDHSITARFLWQKTYSRYMQRHIDRLIDQPEFLDKIIHQSVSAYLENITNIYKKCSAQKIPYASFVQPFRYLNPTSELSAMQEKKARLIRLFYNSLRNQIQQNTFYQSFIHLVPSHLFVESDFVDEVHFSPSGQSKIAHFMSEKIKNLIYCPILSTND